MSEASLAIILAVLGILGGGGFWGYRQSRKEAPIKKRDADLAAADASVQMALAVAVAARDDNAQLRADLNTEREHRLKLGIRVDELAEHNRVQEKTITALRAIVTAFTNGWDDLVERWHHHRQQDQPPARPVAKNITD